MINFVYGAFAVTLMPWALVLVWNVISGFRHHRTAVVRVHQLSTRDVPSRERLSRYPTPPLSRIGAY